MFDCVMTAKIKPLIYIWERGISIERKRKKRDQESGKDLEGIPRLPKERRPRNALVG